MAIVTVEIFERTQEVRDAIIEGITQVLVNNGALREETQVVLYESNAHVWGKGGDSFAKRMADREATEASKSS